MPFKSEALAGDEAWTAIFIGLSIAISAGAPWHGEIGGSVGVMTIVPIFECV